MSRKTIQVSPEVKDRVQGLKDKWDLKNESEVIETLIAVAEDFTKDDKVNIFLFFDLVKKIKESESIL